MRGVSTPSVNLRPSGSMDERRLIAVVLVHALGAP